MLLPENTMKLNYLNYKEFLVHMGMLSEHQASIECRESALIYDVWYSLGQARGSTESEQEMVSLEDLKVFLMAILRLNDGKHFVASNSEEKKEKVYGHINSEQKLTIC